MDGMELLQQVERTKSEFGSKCPRKYAGALAVTLFRGTLKALGIPVSPRDVFIKGVPVEIDLLVPRAGSRPDNCILYQPQDVLVAFEIKNTGVFGQGAVNAIRKNFQIIRREAPHIQCYYVTLTEKKTYKWAVNSEKLGFPAYTLTLYSESKGKTSYEPTDDWQKLLCDLSVVCCKTIKNWGTRIDVG